jgi:hypothetical protein
MLGYFVTGQPVKDTLPPASSVDLHLVVIVAIIVLLGARASCCSVLFQFRRRS